MKSLPEKNFWNNIKTRLSNYTEEPEDDWDDIAAIISPSRYDSRKWIEFSQDIASAVVLILMLAFTVTTTDTVPANTEVATADINTSSDQKTSEEKSTWGTTPDSDEFTNRTSSSSNENRSATRSYKSIESKNAATLTVRPSNYNTDVYAQTDRSTKTDKDNVLDSNVNTSGSDADILPDSQLSAEEKSDQTSSASTTGDQITRASYLADIVKKDSVENIAIADSITHTEAGKKKEELEKKKRTKKFHPAVYVTMSPSLAYQKIIPVKNDAINITELKSDGIFSSNRLGLAIDGGFQVPITKTIEVYAGLSYYQQNQTITYKYSAGTVNEIEGNQDEDYIIKPGMKQKDFSYAMRNAGISAGFFYRLKTDKLMHKIGAGLQYQKGFLKAGEGDTYSNRLSNYFNYQLLYRLELAINPRTNFYIQPSFTHAIHARESLHEPFALKPYRAAIGFGMIYRF